MSRLRTDSVPVSIRSGLFSNEIRSLRTSSYGRGARDTKSLPCIMHDSCPCKAKPQKSKPVATDQDVRSPKSERVNGEKRQLTYSLDWMHIACQLFLNRPETYRTWITLVYFHSFSRSLLPSKSACSNVGESRKWFPYVDAEDAHDDDIRTKCNCETTCKS